MPFSFYITTIYFQWQVCSSVICTRSPACIGDREDYIASPSPVAMYGSTRNNLVIFFCTVSPFTKSDGKFHTPCPFSSTESTQVA